MNELLDDMLEDAESVSTNLPSDESIGLLATYAAKMRNLGQTIEEKLAEVKTLQEEYDILNMQKIPDLFQELGIKKFALLTGQSIEVKSKFVGSISKDREVDCLTWLRENGYESIIKHEVVASFKKGEIEQHKEVIAALAKQNVSYKDKEFVHPQTLQSFIKERVEEADPTFPREKFAVTELRTTLIK